MLIELLEYCLIGVFAGMAAGLLGVGGGIIVVPSLALIFAASHVIPSNVVMHVVAATSLAAMISTTLFSLRAHYQRGTEIWPIFKLLFPGIVMGTILGTILAKFLHTEILRLLFGIFMLVIALHMFFPERQTQQQKLPGLTGRWSASIFIGICSGLLGIGGSTLCIPFLTYCNVSIRNAMGISIACGFVIAVIGTVAFAITGWHQPGMPQWSTGYVYWPAAVAISLLTPWAATLGAALSHRLPVKILKRIFAVFLLIVGLQMLI